MKSTIEWSLRELLAGQVQVPLLTHDVGVERSELMAQHHK
jgi:hypothetical protein